MFDMERVDLGDDNHWMIGNYELLISQGNIKGMKPKQIGKLVIAMMDLIDEKREREEAEVILASKYRRDRPFYMALVARDGEHCSIPGCNITPLDIDHIHPRSKGGTDSLDNLQLLCFYHNRRKSNKDWETFKEKYMNKEVTS